jgi:hypothetical protein
VTDDLWLLIPGWTKFQHYKDRDPVWIKLYMDLRNRDEWRHLTLAERGLLVSLWLEYGAANTVIRRSDIGRLVGQDTRSQQLDSLLGAGFIDFSASKPLALAHARARAKETETEKDSPKSPHRRKPDERMFARPDTVCPDCGETLGAGHLDSCPRMPRLANDLLEEARQ